MHTHRGIALTATYTAATVPLRRDERFLVCMPIWHASPLNNRTMGTLLLGGTVVLQREYEPRAMLEIIQKERITGMFGAPIALIAPVQAVADFDAFDLSSVRSWIYGAGPLDADTARRLMKAYGSDNFHQVYGMSEMGPVGASLSPGEQVEKAGSIGRGGMPGVESVPADRPRRDPNGTLDNEDPDVTDKWHIPAQVMLGITAQESNMWQATRFAVPGVTANSLIGNYYGVDYAADGAQLDPWRINWADADCGYGITQATDGMRLAGRTKPGETALSPLARHGVGSGIAGPFCDGPAVLPR